MGRPRGARNKLTGAHGDLIAAWDVVAGPGTAKVLMRAAILEAEGVEVPILTKKGEPVLDKDGKPLTYTRRDFDPLAKILPYIARKMPDTVEFLPIEAADLDEIERRWALRQDK